MRALAHPDWAAPLLGAFGVLALLLVASVWRARLRGARLGLSGRFVGAERDLVLGTALLALLLALLGPRLGLRTLMVPAEGIDLVVLIDVSRSMDATDAAPSRLARAREAAGGVLLGLAPGDRAALAVFAGRGALLTPLTHDVGALLEMLPALDSGWMSDRGSRLGAGVGAALEAFVSDSPRPRVVLVLGDGEHADVVPAELRERVAREQVRVVAGAIGSEAGTVLRGPTGPVRDANGESVVTRRELRDFTRLADASGGAVLLADEWGVLDAPALLAAVRRGLRPGPGGTLLRELPALHDREAAALAYLLLLAELLSGVTPRLGAVARARLRRSAVAAVALLALGAGGPDLSSLEARVLRAPEDAHALIALGIARAEAGEKEEAARALAAAVVRARTREDIALASYDLGVSLLALHDYAGARDAFFDTLAVDPHDRQAKFNLEWALRALESGPPKTPAEPPPPRKEEAHEPEAKARPQSREKPEPRPAPSPESRPDPSARPAPDAAASGAPPPLTADEVARWLDAVRDVPPPARRGAREIGPAPRSGPQW